MFEYIDGSLQFINSPLVWVDFGITVALIIALSFILYRVFKRTFARIFTLTGALTFVIAWVFGLRLLWSTMLIILTVSLVVFFTINIGEVRKLIANTLASHPRTGGFLFNKVREDKLFDRDTLYDKLEQTISTLSKTKTGALITFERKVDLTDIAKSGTILNSPVTPELLTTIFYPGTRLHDGAVIIRKDLIYAAAVYYTPTTKPLTGKFGSRHRAAIGISEISDSITVVVSEETGRISLAVSGDLIHVSLDNFRRIFEDYMTNNLDKKSIK